VTRRPHAAGSAILGGLVAAGLVLASCGARPVSPSVSPVSPASASTAIGDRDRWVWLDVRFAGPIHCASFPYGCTATLSVLEPDAAVASDWRPSSSDPQWSPDYGAGTSTDHFAPKPNLTVPAVSTGRHQLVISLLGSYDTPSYGPDGSGATDLLARCTTQIDVQPSEQPLAVVVTFVPDPASFGGTCSLAVGPR
jgi:hypothetical protein